MAQFPKLTHYNYGEYFGSFHTRTVATRGEILIDKLSRTFGPREKTQGFGMTQKKQLCSVQE